MRKRLRYDSLFWHKGEGERGELSFSYPSKRRTERNGTRGGVLVARLRVSYLLVVINIVQRLPSDRGGGWLDDSLVAAVILAGRAVALPGDWTALYSYRRVPVSY